MGLSKRCKSLALQVKFGFCPSPRSEIFGVRLSIAGGIWSLSKPCRSNLGRSQSYRPIFGVCLSPAGEFLEYALAVEVEIGVCLSPTG